jgi:hypothetical protein
MDESTTPRGAGRLRRAGQRAATALAAVLMVVLVAPTAFAATGVTVKDTEGLAAVGPTSAANGFPTWYADKANTRLEPCLDGDNPLCGFLPGDIPDATKPIAFPANFPDEFFYFLAGAELALPGGGRAVLTSGLEAAFLNSVQPGDQVTFTRIRVVVRGATPNTEFTFKHPYGELTILTDGTGAGRLVRDIAPSVGNFSLALGGDVGPFLKWTGTDAPAGYLGDPGVPHTVTGGPKRNTFEMWNGAAQVASTDQFTIQGKIATNHGVTADAAVVNGGFVDVFATSESAALHVEGQAGKFVDTLMSHDPNSTRFYARLAVTGSQQVTSVKVVNNQDNPPSSATVDVRAVSVTQATYDGATLTVAASVADQTKYPLTVDAGGTVGTLPSAAPVGFPLTAPPGTITVSSGALKATAPVTITGGPGSPTGTTAPPAGPVVGPVCDPSPCGPGGTPTGNPVARVANVNLTAPRGLATVIDGSGSTNATTFKTVIKSGPQGATVVNDTTNKPSIVLPTWAAPTDILPRAAASTADTIVTFTASNGTASSSVDVKITPARDTVAVTTARSRAGQDLRVDGTSTIPGAGLILTPPTQVVVYARTNAVNNPTGLETGWVKIGSAAVDTTGAFSVRPRPAPNVAYVQYLVQTSRGTQVAGALGR